MPKYVCHRAGDPGRGQLDHGPGGGDFAEVLQCVEEYGTADSVG